MSSESSWSTESSSSSSLTETFSSDSSDTSSLSSVTESFSSSSSSPWDDIRGSEIVFGHLTRKSSRYSSFLYFDISLPDIELLRMLQGRSIDLGGTFAGVTVDTMVVEVADDQRYVVYFGGADTTLQQAVDAMFAWRDRIVGLVQGVLDTARLNQANLSITPDEYRSI